MEIIRMENISKYYPNTVALDHVNFTLNHGEIVSLLGENGAGKTTLMKILYGMTQPDTGKIFLNGEETKIAKPIDAINNAICMVHQHFMLVPAFSVTENIIAGLEPKKVLGFLDKSEAKKEVQALIDKFNFQINPDDYVKDLSVGEQQRVEILKALYRKADIIILDEPTAVLTPNEVDDLFVILNDLRKEGKSFVIITHKLKETMAIADRIGVLRDGVMIENSINTKDVSISELSEMMVGRKVDLSTRHPAKNIGDVTLKVSNLTFVEDKTIKLKDINFEVKSGEIVGIVGIEGNGQTQLLKALTGIVHPEKMKLMVNGKELSGDAREFILNKVGHVPEDRLSLGLVKELSIKKNTILGYHRSKQFSKKGILNLPEIKRYSEELKVKFLVKAPNVDTQISLLSGGNQQKVVIARVFSQDPDVMIIAQPTRGIDVGAIEYIHSQIIEMRDAGKAILLISADLDEVRKLSDRLLVLYEGEIVTEQGATDLTEIQLGLLMTGSSLEDVMEVKTNVH